MLNICNLNKGDKEFLDKYPDLRKEFDDFLDKTYKVHDRVGLLKSVLTPSEYAFNYENKTYISEFKKFVNDKENYINENSNNQNCDFNENHEEEEFEVE